jgi:hypothetical protein
MRTPVQGTEAVQRQFAAKRTLHRLRKLWGEPLAQGIGSCRWCNAVPEQQVGAVS